MDLSSAIAHGNLTSARWSSGLVWTKNWQSQRAHPMRPKHIPRYWCLAAGPFKTSGVLATFVVIAVIAGGLLDWKPHDQSLGDQSSGNESVASSDQAGPASQKTAGSPTRQPVGFGVITISNLKTGTVEVYDQSSIAQAFSPGTLGASIRRPQRYRFLPALRS